MTKKLYRSTTDRKLTGLCAGIAEYADIDVSVVRLLVLMVVILSGVLPGLLAYLLGSIIVPVKGEN